MFFLLWPDRIFFKVRLSCTKKKEERRGRGIKRVKEKGGEEMGKKYNTVQGKREGDWGSRERRRSEMGK